jgi:hypothetical protein
MRKILKLILLSLKLGPFYLELRLFGCGVLIFLTVFLAQLLPPGQNPE